MPEEKICKTVHQYDREPLSAADMERLLEIAEDYRRVKAYVYDRYGGVGSLGKLYPGYTIQNEMTASGLRDRLGLPSVYFYLAVFDALADIKCQWSRAKAKVLELIGKNDGLSPEEKHYLRFLLRVADAFEAVLDQRPVALKGQMQAAYSQLAARVDTEKLHRYITRQVRKYHKKPEADEGPARSFSLTAKAYRYGDGGIYVATKEKRKRVFIPLTDRNGYDRQIRVKLYPERGGIQIDVPVDVAIKRHKDHQAQVGVALGLHTMLTTDQVHAYGKELGIHQIQHAQLIREQARRYSRNRKANPGQKKYQARKERSTERLHSYINHELNLFLQTEKPAVIYMAKLPGPPPRTGTGGTNKQINYSMSSWQRGYIRKRLEIKCREHSIQIVQVLGKDISNVCSACGAMGIKRRAKERAGIQEKTGTQEKIGIQEKTGKDSGGGADRMFVCPVCKTELEEKTNTARNAKHRGMEVRRT